MYKEQKTLNLVMSGGGIKGIAYTGALEAAEKENIRWGNISGVSAGALVGAYASAGYRAAELREVLGEFDFGKIEVNKIQKKVPAVEKYMAFNEKFKGRGGTNADIIEYFLNSQTICEERKVTNSALEFSGSRGSFLKNIITLCKEGCLCDGDYLEDWMYKVLAKKGVKTFRDLRGGIVDKKNPGGYKVRMTAVDANRAKVIVLPDDIAYYGIDPDNLEVHKAVRMSTSVPFAFKPVEIKKQEGNRIKTYHIVDGGVFDNFPAWLHDADYSSSTLGLRLVGYDKNTLLSLDTPLTILKALISSVHDIGMDKDYPKLRFVGDIYTGEVSFLDFNLSEEKKQYLYDSGKGTGEKLIKKYKSDWLSSKNNIFGMLTRIIKNR